MLCTAFGLLATCVLVTSAAVLPAALPTTTDAWNFNTQVCPLLTRHAMSGLAQADFDNWSYPGWLHRPANGNVTETWLKTIDDAWQEVKLMFPITVFNKTSQTIYINMNGIISLDKPDLDTKTVPERPLPVDPKNCTPQPDGGCIPSTAILLLWRDMNLALRPADLGPGAAATVTFSKHKSYPIPHHHFGWFVCDKAAPMDPPTEEENCGRASRDVRMTVDIEKPWIFTIDYWVVGKVVNFGGTIGVQSEGQYLSVPASEIHTSPGSCTRVVFDTKAVTATVINPEKC
ncbi:hypothetical protein ABW21_db0203397 [Orbilia brochopaga]|nr:hypothetical protein ABW21_db0203397 [Drechslerella brochopaga]